MKSKHIYSIFMLVLPCIYNISAIAADDTTINITANIVASPCTISTSNLNIDLGDIQANTLESAGATSPWSPVNTIHLTNCPISTTSVVATFTGTPAVNGDANGYKNVGAGGDNLISVELADDSSTPNFYSNNKTASKTIANNAADINLRARLYTNGAATPGAVASTINVNFEFK